MRDLIGEAFAAGEPAAYQGQARENEPISTGRRSLDRRRRCLGTLYTLLAAVLRCDVARAHRSSASANSTLVQVPVLSLSNWSVKHPSPGKLRRRAPLADASLLVPALVRSPTSSHDPLPVISKPLLPQLPSA